MAPVRRVEGADDGALVLVDATSGAGGLPVDVTEADVYYFGPQKCFAADGGLWLAAFSPAALARVDEIDGVRPLGARLLQPADRDLQQPAQPDLQHAGGRHPGAARGAGALDQRAGRPGLGREADHRQQQPALLLGRAHRIHDPVRRGPVRPLAWWWAPSTSTTPSTRRRWRRRLRANGIVDVEPYRKLGRNQLRVAMFPAVEPDDVSALTTCVDYVVDQLG